MRCPTCAPLRRRPSRPRCARRRHCTGCMRSPRSANRVGPDEMNKLLIANRGEIALRVMRSAHSLGVATVAVYSDADAAGLHVDAATQSFALGGNSAAESYLDIGKLIAAARATGADAVHPGYGFLSENAGFAQAVIDAGLTWVGPPPAAIRALGSKSAVKQLAAQLDIPCLPGYA